jgi:hypothetical protein
MTFAHRIKQEIINNKMSYDQMRTLILGVCYSIGYIRDDCYVLKIKNTVISTLLIKILKKIDISIMEQSSENP